MENAAVSTSKPAASARPWFLIAILVVAYGVSFGLPATGRFAISDDVWMTSSLMGWEAFQKAWDPHRQNNWIPSYYVWYANAWFLLGCILLLLRLGRWAALIGAAGALTGMAVFLEHLQRGWNSQFLIGYWLWVASIAALVPAGLWQWRRGKRTRPSA